MKIEHPIYVISKGRWERPLTARFLIAAKIPFKVAVEPQEYDDYCWSIGEEHVAKLPFANLGLGSTPARNWCWENAIELGHSHHFLFDDNIYGFRKFEAAKRPRCDTVSALYALQEFEKKFANIGMCGYNYHYFATKSTNKAFFLNSHVYSGMLIRNDLPFRWRLKYNEDVDLNLQVLDTKYWCTVALNTYLIEKVSTVAKMKGGNQTELYQNNDHAKKKLKTRSLEMLWPQYVKSTWRFNRPHHQVSWGVHFRQPLVWRVKESAQNTDISPNG